MILAGHIGGPSGFVAPPYSTFVAKMVEEGLSAGIKSGIKYCKVTVAAAWLYPMSKEAETATRLTPKYDANGLVTVVVTDAASGLPLVVAHMNEEALRLTLETGEVHFWSRSRASLWKKGETSGNVLALVEIRVDCDQDALWVRAEPKGPTCHTGATTCFYRRVEGDGSLIRTE